MTDCMFCKIRDGQIPAAITYLETHHAQAKVTITI